MRLPLRTLIFLTAFAALSLCGSAAAHQTNLVPGLNEAIQKGDFPKTTSVLVIEGGAVAYESYFGEGTPDLLNDTRSATKSVTALAVGAAIGDGAISSVDTPAFAVLGDETPFRNDGPAKQAITIKDMLTMSSALACNDDDEKSPGNEDNMHPQNNWTRWAVDLPTRSDYKRDASGLGSWAYCTTNAFLMGQIVERAVREPIDSYIERRILGPLGITKSEWPRSPSGEVMTGGGLRLTSRDLGKLAWLVTERGRWQGKQIVRAAFVDDMTTIHRTAYGDHGYGYFYWQYNYHAPCGVISGWYMAGNGGNAILAFPSLNAAAVVTRENYNAHGMHQQTQALIENYVLPLLCKDRDRP
jgi:CubicO group peptidase (beta-lactamase class C family)